jgi:CheY-like chemotaxis protein
MEGQSMSQHSSGKLQKPKQHEFPDFGPVGYLRIDARGQILQANLPACKLLNTNYVNLMGMSFSHFIAPEAQREFTDFLETLKSSAVIGEIELFLYPENAPLFPAKLYVETRISQSGKLLGYQIAVEDRSTIEQLKHHTALTQDLVLLGAVTGAAVHEFNNILGAIMGFAEMAMMENSSFQVQKNYLEQVLTATHRANALFSQIMNVYGNVVKSKEEINFNHLLSSSEKVLKSVLPPNTRIQIISAEETSLVYGNKNQLLLMLINTCSYMWHKMGGNLQELIFKISDKVPENIQDRVEFKIDEDYFVHFRVIANKKPGTVASRADDATGIVTAFKDDPGKHEAVIRRITEYHEGYLSFEDFENGHRIDFFLPTTALKKETMNQNQTTFKTGTESILFVDDEHSLVLIGKKLLEHLGYNVTAVEDSATALQLFERNPDQFDMIITDQTMPELSGIDLAKKITTIRPEVPVILLTGFRNTESLFDAKSAGITEVVTKPIDIKEFSHKIRNILEARKNK